MTGRSRRGAPADVERALASIAPLRIDALRLSWASWFGDDPPPCQSAELLRRLLAARLQEERFGGLSTDAKRRLRELRPGKDGVPRAAPVPVALKAGTMITREWRGSLQRVHVLEQGFAHDGKQYGSLSQIARKITGKRWSGPRFFGVEAEKGSESAGGPSARGKAR